MKEMKELEENSNQGLAAREHDYNEILQQAVAVIERGRVFAATRVNTSANETRWDIGKLLYEEKLESGHGDGVVKRLSADLSERYPKMSMSVRNLWSMKQFYLRFVDSDIKVKQAVSLLQWGHILRLMQEFHDDDEALYYYAHETLAKGWNRDLMLNAIKLEMHKTHGLTPVDNNFSRTLPAEQADFANETFKPEKVIRKFKVQSSKFNGYQWERSTKFRV